MEIFFLKKKEGKTEVTLRELDVGSGGKMGLKIDIYPIIRKIETNFCRLKFRKNCVKLKEFLKLNKNA